MKIGYKIQKENLKNKEYADCAVWCNKNNCYIADKGDYYEVVENKKIVLSDQEKLKNEVLELERQTGYTRVLREIIAKVDVSKEIKDVAENIEKIAIKLRK